MVKVRPKEELDAMFAEVNPKPKERRIHLKRGETKEEQTLVRKAMKILNKRKLLKYPPEYFKEHGKMMVKVRWDRERRRKLRELQTSE